MLLPLSWLSDFIEIELDPDSLAEALTMTGTEVEAIHRFAVEGVVVGCVESCEKHADADRLTVCTVDVGGDAPLTIVCGAPNVAAGQRVAVAPPGARLPGGLEIKARKMRGVRSEGMILAEDELGIGVGHEGILVLDDDLPIGDDLADHLPLRDTVFELSITPNRGDCLSLLGIARELHALTGAPLFMPPTADPAKGSEGLEERVRIEIRDVDGCPRYAARVVEGVKIGPSPLLWRIRLHRAGMRPINSVVDATNITLLELGQPQHGFDLSHFPSGTVVVRASKDGEEFTTLDGVERKLPAELVMIAADQVPVAVGGVMGGLDSGVTESTEAVLVESAYFDPSRVRKAANSLRIASESSFRFERGVDPERVPDAAARTAWLIATHAGGKVLPGIVDAYPAPIDRSELRLRRERIGLLLGIEIADDDVARILDRLGLAPRHDAGSGEWRVLVPTHRHDLAREIDLVEEVARVHGYDRIPESTGLAGRAPAGPSAIERLITRVEEQLVGIGFAGSSGNSFLGPGDLAALRLDAEGEAKPIRIGNPIGEEQSLMRPSLLPSLMAAARGNSARGRSDLRLFEIGKVFEDLGGRHERGAENRFVEREVLTLLATGEAEPLHWGRDSRLVDFYDCRGIIEHLLRGLGLGDAAFDAEAALPPFLDPGRAASLRHGQIALGWVGLVDEKIAGAFDLPRPVVIAHLDLEELLPLLTGARHYEEPSRFPASRRDLSLLMPPGLSFARIEERIRAVAKKNLRDIEVFDVYEGKPLEPGQKSVALRLTYRAQDRTLTDDEIKKSQDRIIRTLQEELDVGVRGA